MGDDWREILAEFLGSFSHSQKFSRALQLLHAMASPDFDGRGWGAGKGCWAEADRRSGQNADLYAPARRGRARAVLHK